MATARGHHFISQCYLKGFAAHPERPLLFVIDAKTNETFTTSPANIAKERDFNRIDVDGHPPDAMEEVFSQFESELAPALTRIREARSLDDESDRATLFNFIGLLAIRNPRLRETMRAAQEQTAKVVMELATSSPQIWNHHLKKAREGGFLPAVEGVDDEELRRLARFGSFEFEVSTTEHLRREMEVFDTLLPYIFGRKWLLLRAPRGSAGFVTTDHPVCLTWTKPVGSGPWISPGLGLAGTRLIFPISNELAALGEFEGQDLTVDASELLIAQTNTIIMIHARRQIYARDDDFAYASDPISVVRRGRDLLGDPARRRPTDD